MRLSRIARLVIIGASLVLGIASILPCLAFGAARSFGSAGNFRPPVMHRRNDFSHRFNRFGLVPFGFGGVHDFGDQPVIIIQQFQPATDNGGRESALNQIYVPPRWVDGGYGVQVLMPGYWTNH
jgi:hypothetical protein